MSRLLLLVISLCLIWSSPTFAWMNSYAAGKQHYQYIAQGAEEDTTLTWDVVADVTGYKVYNQNSELLATVETNECTLQLLPGKHILWVTAFNEDSESNPSQRLAIIIRETE